MTTLEQVSNKIWNGGAKLTHTELDEILKSFAREIHNAAIESAVAALPAKHKEVPGYLTFENTQATGYNTYRKEALASLPALKSGV